MGSFFTNVQVRTRDTEGVVKRLSQREGFRAANAGEKPDRSIIVRTSGAWTSVYDQATESQNDADLDALAEELSAGTRAFTVLVHDSDVLLLTGFENQERTVRFDSNPAFSGKKKAKPDLKAWSALLDPRTSETEEALAHVLAAEDLFAEETMRKLAVLFGLPVRNATLGYGYAEHEPGDRVIALVLLERPEHERAVEGPPRFEMGAHHRSLELTLGAAATAGFAVRNAGGASRGVDIVLAGDAIDQRLVRPVSCELFIGAHEEGVVRVTLPFEGAVASFPSVELPAGAPMTGFAPGIDPVLLVRAMQRSNVHANLGLEVLKTGEAELIIGFVPRASPDEGQWGYAVNVSCMKAPRRPLRAPADVEPHVLRPLEQNDGLYAVASSRLSHAEAAEIAIELLPRWAPALDGEGKARISVFRSTPGARPKSGETEAQGFFEGKRWKRMHAELRAEALVGVERHSHGADGFGFGRGIIPQADELPSLVLFASTQGRSASEVKRLHGLLVELTEEFLVRAKGMQAFTSHWRGLPIPTYVAYEQATSVAGAHALTSAWQSRWLRAVTDDFMWLPDALLAHVKDSGALARAAELTRVHGFTRVKAKGSLDALEAALADVLPSHADWLALLQAKRAG